MGINSADINMKRICFALDLKDDPALIREYEVYHESVWPEIIASIKGAGIVSLEIYRAGNRLFMIMETNEDFSLSRKSAQDSANPTVQKWETLMWKYQQAIPAAQPGEKWVMMNKIFDLADY
jgi:L-rhamnose mutarotase